MSHTVPTLAIDAGQSGMKVRVVLPDGTRDHTYPGIQTHADLAPQLARIARAVIAESSTPIERITAGVSGLTSGDTEAAELALLLGDAGKTEIVLAHDSITSFLGAIGSGAGAVIAAGTGIVTLAVGPRDVARVDGWGNIMGDAGSGYWIGRAALDAVMRAFDGRGPATALTDVVRGRWPELPEAYMDLQAASDRVQVVASFAEPTAVLAAEGDAVASGIIELAASEMALSVSAGIERVSLSHDPTIIVCAIGGVLRSGDVRGRFERHLSDRLPTVVHVSARGVGLDGAVALGNIGEGHPLRSHVSVARRPN
jgi:glucosamine kinase